MNKGKGIIKRIAGTLMLPVAMYIIMMILCYSNGKMYFGTWAMWRTLIVDIAVSVTCAFGIGLQFKNGRFDFSGGAIMLIAAIIAGNLSANMGSNPIVFFVLCVVICVVLSLLVGMLYVFGRIPIIIATIGMALLYEALTCLVFGGRGITLIGNMQLKKFSTYPLVLLPLVLAIAIYAFYSYKTVTGKQAAILANNQQSAVNIGVKEGKNVIISYIFSGLIFGCATSIYASTSIHNASFTSLMTVGELFSNILPVFIGLMVAGFCGDTIGTMVGSVSLCLMSFGLKAVFDADMGASIATIVTSIFILAINVISAQGGNVIKFFKTLFTPKAKAA